MAESLLLLNNKLAEEHPKEDLLFDLSDAIPQASAPAGLSGISNQVSRRDHAHPTTTVAELFAAGQLATDPLDLLGDADILGELGISDLLPRVDHQHPKVPATIDIVGQVELATDAESVAGTSTSLAVTPHSTAAAAQADAHQHATVAGTANAIILTSTPIRLGLTHGAKVTFKAANTTSITTPTIDLDGLGPTVVVKNSNEALAVGEIVANTFHTVVYDSDLTKFVLVSGVLASTIPDISSASTTNLTISLGAGINFTAAPNDFLNPGMFITLTSAAVPTEYMWGVVTAYTPGSGATVFTSLAAEGLGVAHADWNINLAGLRGISPTTTSIFTLVGQLFIN